MNDIKKLLAKETPVHRQAYSDRTCWLMACLSELAYTKFNPLLPESTKDYFLERINSLIDDNRKSSLLKLIKESNYDPEAEEKKLKNQIENLEFTLISTFDKNGTQAILVQNDKFLVLAFRGTEIDSIKDIKADLKATLTTCSSGGKIHKGFNEAYLEVAEDIENELDKDEYKNKPLLITGHSLGGALATIAAKKLKYKKIAACYTFGAPRSSNEDWVATIKTPIYRIVNAADCVTTLLPSGTTVFVIAWIAGYFGLLRCKSFLLKYFGGYSHAGNMRYLTNCSHGTYDDVQLLYSATLFRRFLGWLKKHKPFGKLMTDHSILIYKEKLIKVALRRNPDDEKEEEQETPEQIV